MEIPMEKEHMDGLVYSRIQNMGQKRNPLGFRLGTTQSHHSLWFARPNHFPAGLQEDERIRDCIKNYVQKKMGVFSGMIHIRIQKTIDSIKVIISMGFSNLFTENQTHKMEELRTQEMEEFRRNVQKKFNPMNQRLKFDILITKMEQKKNLRLLQNI
jgi:small subunit ribosomal protein S3